MKARIVLTLGPDEAAKGQVSVKNLVNGEQVLVKRDEVAEWIRKILAGVAS
jgi:histidyl-tRNA synthetase